MPVSSRGRARRRFGALPRAEGAQEMLDRPAPFAEVSRSLRDVERLNGLFGGRAVTVGALARLLARVPTSRPLTVLDVGTGGGDIPRALVRWARRAGRHLRVIALDRDAGALRAARLASSAYPEITLLRADALALPVRPGSVDVVMCALILHHLEPGPAAAALADMDRAARLGVVVNDLVRGRVAYAAVWLATRLLARSPMSRHDGPLSVLRAYTPAEVRGLVVAAGLDGVRVRRHPFRLRLCAVRVKR